MAAISDYFIQRSESTPINLYTTYRCYVISSKGLYNRPTPKESFIEDWVDTNGQRVYELVNRVYKPMDVTLEFAFVGDVQTCLRNLKNMVNYMSTVTPVSSGAIYGSSAFYFWNTNTGTDNKALLRYDGFNDGELFAKKEVIDMKNPGQMVSRYSCTLKFKIDNPV